MEHFNFSNGIEHIRFIENNLMTKSKEFLLDYLYENRESIERISESYFLYLESKI